MLACLTDDVNIEDLNNYLKNFNKLSPLHNNSSKVFGFFLQYRRNNTCLIQKLNMAGTSILQNKKQVHNNLTKAKEYNKIIIEKMFKTNSHLRVFSFPGDFSHVKVYHNALETNYSLTDISLFDSDTITQRNKILLESTKKSCLLLIGIKKFRNNPSKEFKMLTILDRNIVRLVSLLVFYNLKNNKDHLKLLATKI
jgi:hypothetical protein